MILVGSLTNPQMSSEQEILNITLQFEKGSVFFFAIRAYDEAGNHGAISNTLQVDLTGTEAMNKPKHFTDVYPPKSTADPSVTVTSYSDGNNINEDGKNKQSSIIIYILVSVIGIISASCLLIGFRVASKLKSLREVSHSSLDGNAGSEMVIKQ